MFFFSSINHLKWFTLRSNLFKHLRICLSVSPASGWVIQFYPIPSWSAIWVGVALIYFVAAWIWIGFWLLRFLKNRFDPFFFKNNPEYFIQMERLNLKSNWIKFCCVFVGQHNHFVGLDMKWNIRVCVG